MMDQIIILWRPWSTNCGWTRGSKAKPNQIYFLRLNFTKLINLHKLQNVSTRPTLENDSIDTGTRHTSGIIISQVRPLFCATWVWTTWDQFWISNVGNHTKNSLIAVRENDSWSMFWLRPICRGHSDRDNDQRIKDFYLFKLLFEPLEVCPVSLS